ncbi:hypothetical protein [Nocardia wallacei]|uniref:hypothetical protein n=1 Tax=Nocardia wallacei TaxID=480035 RepID=UPI002457DEB6|nr:hypothetical protein [Nocardia wallacei]
MNPRPLLLGYFREDWVLDAADTERQLAAFAFDEGFCFERAYRDAGTSTGSLWVLANELDRGDIRDVAVPSRLHLDGAPGPKRVVCRLWEMDPAVRLWSLEPGEGQVVLRRRERGAARSRRYVTELDAFRCPVSDTGRALARLHVHECLARAGLRDMATAVDTVVTAFVDEAVAAARRRTSREYPIYTRTTEALHKLGSEAIGDMWVRLLINVADQLVVEVVESREHDRDGLPMAVVPLGDWYGRIRPREGGTLSWCALPLTAAWTEMAAAVRAHHNVVAGGAW